MTRNWKLIVVCCATGLSANPAIAQGGGGFGATLGAQNVGPRYPGDEEKDVGGCVWRRQWIIDDQPRTPRVAAGPDLLLMHFKMRK